MPRKARIRPKPPRNTEPEAPSLTWLTGGVGNPDHEALDAHARHLERRLEATPGDAATLRELGMVAAEAARVLEALEYLQAAVAAAPEPLEALLTLAQVQMKAARWAESEATYARVVALDPANATAHAERCWALRRLGRLDASLEAGRAALHHDPGNLLGHTNLAFTHLARDDSEQALDICRRALTLDPLNTSSLAFMPSALDGLGRREEGREIADLDRSVWMSMVESPAGHASLASFNAALVELVERTPTRPLDDTQTRDLMESGEGVALELRAMLDAAVRQYLAGLPDEPGHPYHGQHLERWRLEAWGTRVTGVDALEHHYHQHGWVSGVYYSRVPPTIGADGAGMDGFLEFCRFPQYGAVERESEFMAVPPHEGLLVVFPSYAYHRIVPFSGNAHRISIAFNALPVRD